MSSTTPVTDSQMRRADSMAKNSVVIAAPAARELEIALNVARREIDLLLAEIDQLRSVALQHVLHAYEGDCPDENDKTLRAYGCPACLILGPNV